MLRKQAESNQVFENDPKTAIAADSKSAGLRLHRFESCSHHHFIPAVPVAASFSTDGFAGYDWAVIIP